MLLNIMCFTHFCCLYCWLWIGKCHTGDFLTMFHLLTVCNNISSKNVIKSVKSVKLSYVLEHTSHLTLFSIQLAGCYLICKTVENVEHLGYWLKVYHFVCHFSFYVTWAFCNYLQWVFISDKLGLCTYFK